MVQMYKATIYKVHNDKTPMTVDILKYNMKQSIQLSNGLSINKMSEPLITDILIFIPAGASYVPAENDKVEVIIDDNNFSFCLPIDINIKPLTTAYNPIIGNFKTNNTLQFIDNNLNIKQEEALNIVNKQTNVQSENILLGNNAVKQVAYVGCMVDMNPNSATYGQIITGSSKVMVAE